MDRLAQRSVSCLVLEDIRSESLQESAWRALQTPSKSANDLVLEAIRSDSLQESESITDSFQVCE